MFTMVRKLQAIELGGMPQQQGRKRRVDGTKLHGQNVFDRDTREEVTCLHKQKQSFAARPHCDPPTSDKFNEIAFVRLEQLAKCRTFCQASDDICGAWNLNAQLTGGRG
ncbi:hypothetical protein ASD52_28270 [Ensifer sp. Root142]|nr:hypothetical protein ASD52_28270 [Ensifer sp. Root142]OMQ41657.1 hypothetical protein BKP54_27510 [Ensifer sp. 1H6]